MRRDKVQQVFRCIHCMEQCYSLYYECGGILGTAKNRSLKLNQCKVCQQTVDPYCERECILIVLDLILLRHEAYRHALYNEKRYSFHINDSSKHLGIPYIDFIQFFWKELLYNCILRAYHVTYISRCSPTLQWMKNAFEVDVSDSDFISYVRIVFNFGLTLMEHFITSLIGSLAFSNVVILLLVKTQSNATKISTDIERNAKYFRIIDMIAKSILWPQIACQVTTACLGVWEYSSTTLSLGCTLLVILYQWVALQQTILSLVVSTNLNVDTIEARTGLRKSVILATFILIAGIFVRASSYYVFMYITTGTDTKELICPGFSLGLKYTMETKFMKVCMA